MRTISSLAVALSLSFGLACGDDPASSNDGGTNPDGSIGDEGLTNPDGGPIDPGGNNGGGPALLELKCPELSMPGGSASAHVDASSGGGDGSSGSPFKTIGEAIGTVGDGGVIWVAAGTYKESLSVSKNVTIMGGFAPGFGSRTDACATILEGGGGKPVIASSASVKSFALDGVTVQKGARGLTTEQSSGATYTITSSVFADNGSSSAVGGAVYLDRVSANFKRVVFRNNRAEKGAAIAMYSEADTITIDGCLFEENVGHSDHGGALYLSPKTGAVVRSTFRRNQIGKDVGYGWGGAAIVYKGGSAVSKVDFAYNVFTENLAGVGAAVFVDEGASVTMSHDLIYRNRSILENGVARGGAIYVDGTGSANGGSTLVGDHLTVANNNYDPSGKVTQARGGGVYLESYSKATFTNSIFWNNGNDTFWGDPTTSVSASHTIAPAQCGGEVKCNIGTGVFLPTEINFVDEAANDYHEKSTAGHFAKGEWVTDTVTSEAIDKADPGSTVEKEPAPNGGRANLGVFGRTIEASKSP